MESPVDDFAGLELVPEPVIVLDGALRLVAVNRRAERFFGLDREDWIGRVPLELLHPDDLPEAVSSNRSVREKEVGTPIELRVRMADGSYRLVECIGAAAPPDLAVLSFRDLTERRRWEVANDEHARFRSVVENGAVILALVEADGTVDSISGAFTRELGHNREDVLGRELSVFVVADDRERFSAHLRSAAPGRSTLEVSLLHHDGRGVPFQVSVANLIDDPVVRAFVVSAVDISRRRALEDRLAKVARTDSLTGLANRTGLIEHLTEMFARRSRRTRLVAYLLDLDRFKPVNDIHGHDAGDRVLVEVAQRLRAVTRAGDFVARLGGDEFVVVCTRVADGAHAAALAARIESELARSIPIGNTAVSVAASIGYVFADADATTPDALLAEADAAMYRSKLERRGHQVHRPMRVAQQRELAEDLANALRHDPAAAGLRLWYQPVVALPGGEVVGAEALVRWHHPVLGRLRPDAFVPLAIDAGLDVRLGAWVLDEAVRHATRHAAGLPRGVAVNFTAAQLADDSIVRTITQTLDRHGLTPGRLCIEVTEQTMLERTHGGLLAASAALDRLHLLGVRIAIDDFGTGYSSMMHVRELPVDVLKIDRSFVRLVDTDVAGRGIVAAIATLAHATGKEVVAEGVERIEEHRVLESLGVDLVQGFLYGREEFADAEFYASVAGSAGSAGGAGT